MLCSADFKRINALPALLVRLNGSVGKADGEYLCKIRQRPWNWADFSPTGRFSWPSRRQSHLLDSFPRGESVARLPTWEWALRWDRGTAPHSSAATTARTSSECADRPWSARLCTPTSARTRVARSRHNLNECFYAQERWRQNLSINASEIALSFLNKITKRILRFFSQFYTAYQEGILRYTLRTNLRVPSRLCNKGKGGLVSPRVFTIRVSRKYL